MYPCKLYNVIIRQIGLVTGRLGLMTPFATRTKMTREDKAQRKRRVLAGIYSSSMGMSLTAMIIVAVLEVFMLGFSIVNSSLYGEELWWKYRIFYIVLLVAALVYIAISLFVKRDIKHRHTCLNIVNPLYAVLFYAWALGITYFDAMIYGAADPMVFMTFSLTVPLSFFLLPSVYAIIVAAADVFMAYLAVTVVGSWAPLINLSIFFVFQIALGIGFLRLKMKLNERIVEEQENADVDVLTGFPNRRVYEADMKGFLNEPGNDDLVYVSIDLNGLKEINDHYGHEFGDKFIIGAAECIEKCFGEKGKTYRIGGDEFVALIHADRDELTQIFGEFDVSTRSWSDESGLSLSTACGYAFRSEYPDEGLAKLARVADKRMYVAKARYYQESGRDRRGYLAADPGMTSGEILG